MEIKLRNNMKVLLREATIQTLLLQLLNRWILFFSFLNARPFLEKKTLVIIVRRYFQSILITIVPDKRHHKQ